MAMATSTEKNRHSDWDQDEEDNWDDWGDAEDNFEVAPAKGSGSAPKAAAKAQNNNTVQSEKDENSQRGTPSEAAQQPTNGQRAAPMEHQKSSWGSLWGAVISTASDITSTVSQGLNQVIGVPDPEELARQNAAEAQTQDAAPPHRQPKESDGCAEDAKAKSDANAPVFGLSLVSGVTTLGSKVLNTGLDTLEGIGKKTMTMLQENDPLLKNKRKLLGLEAEKPNLSEVLKEAKTDAERLENTLKELNIEKSKQMLRFEVLFENHCGLVHLEALEILSKESTLKLQTLMDAVSGNALTDLQETLNEVKELMELEEFDAVDSDGDYDGSALGEHLRVAIEDADLKINFDDIVSTWTQTLDWLATAAAEASEQDTFARGITALAETCALEMNKLHKIAELLLVKEHHSTANEVDCIVQLCKQFSVHLNGLTNRYAATLTSRQTDTAKTHISTLFAEMLVATQHIENAFNLFLPILQIGAV